ncbi:putative rRNA-processing protein EBP2 [Saccoglossus kowalevskii]|uniref:Probable rRNA-processing protein EBP2-like n=1 Tax=Saccoglossus kowalevskii TaxID=10224 RepID=A0ABM0GTR6_SACKO|nr:PREDICTED: probable rRNA-processing protein EBP2-like [Saccoglossus kowalevskii]
MADYDEESVSELESYDSDDELQSAFNKGELKPGLNYQTRAPKQYTNNTVAIDEKLNSIQSNLDWIERVDITLESKNTNNETDAVTDDDNDDLMHNDFKRELKFYQQAQSAVLVALPRIRKLGILTKRPDDYFAEMAKSDEHMRKVRQKLLGKQLAMERSEKAKKLRELRKYGKQVQREVLQKRQKEKKELLDSVKKFRKGQKDKLEFANRNIEAPSNFKGKPKKISQPQGKPKPNPKRVYKDQKFGLGGSKKRSKSNTADSAANVSDFKSSKHSYGTGPKFNRRNTNKKKNRRHGKIRREKTRVKARR